MGVNAHFNLSLLQVFPSDLLRRGLLQNSLRSEQVSTQDERTEVVVSVGERANDNDDEPRIWLKSCSICVKGATSEGRLPDGTPIRLCEDHRDALPVVGRRELEWS